MHNCRDGRRRLPPSEAKHERDADRPGYFAGRFEHGDHIDLDGAPLAGGVAGSLWTEPHRPLWPAAADRRRDKLFTKEDWIPPFADRAVFVFAPTIVMTTALLSFAIVPVAPGIVIADLNIGLLFFLAMTSLGVYSVV